MKTSLALILTGFLILALPAWSSQDQEIDNLVGKLKGFNFSSIKAAQAELVEIGSPAIPRLRKALKDPDPGIRKGAAQVLGQLKVVEAVDEIGALVKDDQYWVARGAVYSLKDIGSPKANPYFVQALSHFNPKVKETALYQVRENKLIEAKPKLADRMLRDLDQYVRWLAMTTLRDLEPGAEITVIREALVNPKLSVTQKRNAIEFAGNLKIKESISELVSLLKNKDSGVRWRALEALGKLDAREARLEIEQMLADKDEGVRMMAIGVLGILASSESIPALTPMLRGQTAIIRKNAIRSLERIGGVESATAIRSALPDSDKYVRAQAAEALGQIGGIQDVSALIKAASDKYAVVRAAACRALGQLKDPEALEVLTNRLEDKNFWVREEATQALKKIKPREQLKVLADSE